MERSDASAVSSVVGRGAGTVLGGGAMRDTTTMRTSFVLASLDLDQPEQGPRTLGLGFLAHGITPSPHRAGLYLLFEKHGPGCAAVDLAARQVVCELRPSRPSRQFYGHGTFTDDGALMLCTETDLADERRGYIVVRDGRSFEVLGEAPSFGLAPHDCMFAADRKTLVISNGGSPAGSPTDENAPSITFVDIDTRRLLERVPVPDPRINAGHLALTPEDDLVLTSAPRDGLEPTEHRGGISLKVAGRPLRTLTEPPDVIAMMKGETLSVAIHPGTRTVGVTNPLGQIVTFWDLDSGELRHHLRVPAPRGITISHSGDAFVVNFGDSPRAALVDARTLQPLDTPGNRAGYPSMITGSHVMLIESAAVGP